MPNVETDEYYTLSADIKKYKNAIFVIKYGGSIVKNVPAKLAFFEDVARFVNNGIKIVLVHGGGPEINYWLEKFGIKKNFIQGLRVTDKETMNIVEMSLSGLVNKELSYELSLRGIQTAGISGKDSSLLVASKKIIYDDNNNLLDIGYVGEIKKVNSLIINNLLKLNILPIISPIACDENGNTYNINADYAASAIASELKADKLIIMTDIEGVYKDINDKNSLFKTLTPKEINTYINEGVINGGMIPKLQCCMEAISGGAKSIHLLDGRNPHALLNDTFSDKGTKIINDGGF